nr:helix-hairpin-helix domain-containing protein [Granulicella sp. dw_53]
MATDDEFTEILEYLAKNVTPQATAKVNMNKATAAEMESSLELSVKEAEAVVSYRTKNGDFKSLEDVKKVPDVDAKKLDAKKDRLTF